MRYSVISDTAFLICLALCLTVGSSGNASQVPDEIFRVLLHGNSPLTSVVPNGTMNAAIRSNVSSPRDVLWAEDEHFSGPIFSCDSETRAHLEVEGFEELAEPLDSFAVSFWFRARDSLVGSNSSVISPLVVVPTSPDTTLHVELRDSQLCVGGGCTSDLELQDDNWHHLTISSNEDGTMDAYIGGAPVSVDTFEPSQDGTTSTSSLLLCYSVIGEDVFDGYIADVVVFGRSLSEDEVVLNYNLRGNPFTSGLPGLCSDVLIPGVITTTECGKDMGCYIFPERDLSTVDSTLALTGFGGRIGVCVNSRVTELLPPPNVVPPANAFFPLNLNVMSSFPLSMYKGDGRGVYLVEDELFGQALYCNAEEDGFVALDSVGYGVGGRFSINMWFNPDRISGKGHSWLFSHGQNGDDPMGANQVQIYLTEDAGSEYGHVSALVHDWNDEFSGFVDPVGILHSDGTIGGMVDGNGTDGQEAHDIHDGDWHMVTLTSNPMGEQGYVLYVDGEEVNRLDSAVEAQNVLGRDFDVIGGEMLMISNEMLLCGRGYSREEEYPFQGKVAFLSVWEGALDPRQVRVLYDTVAQKGVSGGGDVKDTGIQEEIWMQTGTNYRYSTLGNQCVFPAIFQGAAVHDCVTFPDGTSRCDVGDVWEECLTFESGLIADVPSQGYSVIEEIYERTTAGGMLEHCLLTESPDEASRESSLGCKDGFMCAPYEHSSSEDGICIQNPSSIARYDIFNYMNMQELPQPLSLYPLLDGSLSEVTFPANEGVGSPSWRYSQNFRAQVPDCTAQESRSLIGLVASTTHEPGHTECIWFAPSPSFGDVPPEKQMIMSNEMMTVVLEYVPSSQGKYSIGIEGIGQNSIQESWSDSGQTEMKSTIDSNGEWHFMCASAFSSYNKTEVTIYLDGTLESSWVSRDHGGLHDGIGEASDVFLCPYFNGQVSQYVNFGTSLSEKQVKSLYDVFRDSGIIEEGTGVGQDDGNSGLSGGAIAGIVIGSVVAGGLLAILLIIVAKKYRRSRPNSFRKYKNDSGGFASGDLQSDAGDGSRSLREQFSYQYSASELEDTLSRALSENLSRNFSYEYEMEGSNDQNGSMGQISKKEDMMVSNPTYAVDTPQMQSRPKDDHSTSCSEASD
jgi:hypothetical protein